MDPLNTLEWLLAGDPSIRWQTEQDLLGLPEEHTMKTRERIATEGWGAAIVKQYDPLLRWGVADFHTYYGTPEGSSLFMLQLLMELGILPDDPLVNPIVQDIAENVRHGEGKKLFFDGETEACINGRLVSIGVYWGFNMTSVVRELLGQQLPDGGWNCEAPVSQKSSVHSTLAVIKGLWDYAQTLEEGPLAEAINLSLSLTQEYFIRRRLLYRLSDGKVMDPGFREFTYPNFWQYDVLNVLDEFQRQNQPYHAAFDEAIELILQKQTANGRWVLDRQFPSEPVKADLEKAGEESRWITLKALRILKWKTDNIGCGFRKSDRS